MSAIARVPAILSMTADATPKTLRTFVPVANAGIPETHTRWMFLELMTFVCKYRIRRKTC
jgi:hypothetical protein